MALTEDNWFKESEKTRPLIIDKVRLLSFGMIGMKRFNESEVQVIGSPNTIFINLI